MEENKCIIPPELAAMPQWVCYGRKDTSSSDKAYKMPHNPLTGYGAKAGQSDTWTSFQSACDAVRSGNYAGVGFEFSANGIVGVDFDHCIDQSGALDAWVLQWVERLGSYTEISPSGTGLHVFCKGSLPGKAVKRPKAEMYDRDRYFTVTGNSYGAYKPLCAAQDAINALYEELTADSKKPQETPTQPHTALLVNGKDYIATGLEKDAALQALWTGSRPNGNESADDIALMNKLAYWCNCEQDRMKAAFYSSPHYLSKDPEHMKKANREDYMRRTIEKALQDCTKTAAMSDMDYHDARQAKAGDVFGRLTPTNAPKAPLLMPMSSVEPRKASYLINPYLPQGMLAIMGGISGVGKTFLVLSWAAAISKGSRLPFQKPSEPAPPVGYVYYFTQENDPNIVIRPRLDALGADNSKILIQCQSGGAYTPLTLNDARLEDAAKQYPPALIIFDPIQSYLGTGVEMNKANEVRPILDWLGDYAKRHNCTVVLVSHMSKPGAGVSSALDRLLGSSDFRNAARSIIVVGRDPENKDVRVFAHGKNSIGEPGRSQRYHIESGRGVVYDGECDLTEDDIVKQAQPGARAKPAATLTAVRKQLEELMGADGFATMEQVETLQVLQGFSRGTLYDAKREMAIQSVSIGKPPNRKSWWLLPEVDAAKFKHDHTPAPEQMRLK